MPTSTENIRFIMNEMKPLFSESRRRAFALRLFWKNIIILNKSKYRLFEYDVNKLYLNFLLVSDMLSDQDL